MQINVNQEFKKALAFYREGKIKEAMGFSQITNINIPNSIPTTHHKTLVSVSL